MPITEAQLAKGYQQAKENLRIKITFAEAHYRILANLPVIVEETSNERGYPVFRYFLP